MTTTIDISLNVPPHYKVERLKQQLTDYANRLIAEESVLCEDVIALTPEMAAAAKIAEQQFVKGQCIGMSGFNERFSKWL
jgi:hypothetical protein